MTMVWTKDASNPPPLGSFALSSRRQIRASYRHVVPGVGVHLFAAKGLPADPSDVRRLPVQEQQCVRRSGFRVGDGAVVDHVLDVGTGEPGRPHVLLLELPLRRAVCQVGGQENPAPLAGHAWRDVERAERGQPAGQEPCFFAQLGRFGTLPSRHPALAAPLCERRRIIVHDARVTAKEW